MLNRLGKRVRSLLQREISLEMQVCAARREREPFDLTDVDLFAHFRPVSIDLEEAKRAARQGRITAAQRSLADHLRDRLRPRFFLHPAQREKLVGQAIKDERPVRKLLKAAEEARSRNFAPLGLKTGFPNAIDWFSDFQDSSWIFGADSDLRDVLKRPNEESEKDMGPVEATWLFNQHGHFTTMGRAYWLTGSEALVSEFVVQAVDWAERNPALFGINWIDPTTIAARTVNWMLSLPLFLSSEQLQDEVAARLVRALLVHGAVLADLLSDDKVDLSASEGCAVSASLCLLSLTLPELKQSQRWYELSSALLPKRAWESMGRDGLHLSGSASRHRELLEWLLLNEILHRLNGLPSPKGLREAVETACESLALITPPDRIACDLGTTGAVTFVGHFVGATEHSRRLLALGAIACQRDDFRPGVEMPPELWWWLGPQAEGLYEGIDIGMSGVSKTRNYSEAGLAVSRDRWDRQANWCLLRGSPKTSLLETTAPPPASIPLHDDSLHLSLCLGGESVFIEPGGPPFTHLVQPTFARIHSHSAPRIGREREPLCLERVANRLEETIFETSLGGAARYLGARRPVWLTPEEPWTLWREVLFLPESKHVAIRDSFHGDPDREVDFETNLLLSPHLDILMRGDMGCLIRGKSLQARLVPIFPCRFRYSLRRGQTKPVSGWCFRDQRAVPTYTLRYFTRIKAPFSSYLWLVWDPNDTRVPRTEDLDRQFAQGRTRLNLDQED